MFLDTNAPKVNSHTVKNPELHIGNDVWIDRDVKTFLWVTEIGNGVVISADSFVTKNVPAYSIVGGVPAKVIKYRFS